MAGTTHPTLNDIPESTRGQVIDAEAKKHTILREDVEELQASTKSLMPDGFENQVKPDELANLLDAVERFEHEVEAHGGDLMVDDLRSSRPDDPHYVVPRRAHGEVIRAYIGRIDDATASLRRHPPRPD